MIEGYENLRVGLLGETLKHSISPLIHHAFADYSYRLFEVPKGRLFDFLENGDFDCLNVTIPHKRTVLPYLSKLTEVAKATGAVNCIKKENGKLVGHNSDVYGFSTLLERSGVCVFGKKVLILGSGGASCAVRYVLREKGAKEIVVISRQGDDNYQNITRHRDADIIINATPVGMYPNAFEKPPLSLSDFPSLMFVADLIYRPQKTLLLREAEKRGIQTANGLSMLVAQAKEAVTFFTGVPLPDSEIQPVIQIAENALQNIVLIGMPGCGKTTVGKALAKATGRPFLDADEAVLAAYRKTPEAMIQTEGEKAFRIAEASVLRSLSMEMGSVIATGGGAVLHDEEMEALKANGKVVFLTRDWQDCPTDGRPISQSESLQTLYEKRAPLYHKYADFICQNDGIASAMNRIIKELSL